MSIEKCPKCGNNSLITTPHGRIETEKLFTIKCELEYSKDCLDKTCKWTSGIYRVKSKL